MRHVYHSPQWFVMAQAVSLVAEEQIWAAQQESTMHLISQQLLTNRGQGQPADEKERVNTQVTSQFKSVDCTCLVRIFLVQKFLFKKKKTEARYLVSRNLLRINPPKLFVLLKALIWCNPCYHPHLLTGTPLFQPARRLRNKAKPGGHGRGLTVW